MGIINVAVPITPPTVNRLVSATVNLVEGRWQANVSFNNEGNWVDQEWGTPQRNGQTLAVKAVMQTTMTLVALPPTLSNTYDLGELTPGTYRFVFYSNQGHQKSMEIVVPGEAPQTVAAFVQDTNSSNALSALPMPAAAAVPQSGDLLDYYLAGTSRSAVAQPTLVNGRPHLSLSYRRVVDASPTIRPIIEVSHDLNNWQAASSEISTSEGEAGPDGGQDVTVTQTAATGTPGAFKYMRLRLTETLE